MTAHSFCCTMRASQLVVTAVVLHIISCFVTHGSAFISSPALKIDRTASQGRRISDVKMMFGSARNAQAKLKPMQSPYLYRLYKLASIKQVHLDRMSTLSPAEYYLGLNTFHNEKPRILPLKSINSMVNATLARDGKFLSQLTEKKLPAGNGMDRKAVVGGLAALAAVALLDRRHTESKEVVVETPIKPERGGLFAWRSRGQEEEAEEEPAKDEDSFVMWSRATAVAGATFSTVKVVASTSWTVGKMAAQAAWMGVSGVVMMGKFVGQTVEATAPVVKVVGEEVLQPLVQPLIDQAAPVVKRTVDGSVQQAAPLVKGTVDQASLLLNKATPAVQPAVQGLTSKLSTLRDSQLGEAASKAGQSVQPVVQQSWAVAGPVLGKGLQAAAVGAWASLSFLGHLLVTAVTQGFNSAGEELRSAMVSGAASTMQVSVDVGREALEKTADIAGDLAEQATPVVQESLQKAAESEAVKGIQSESVKALSTLQEKVKLPAAVPDVGALNQAVGGAVQKLQDAGESVLDKADDVLPVVQDLGQSVATATDKVSEKIGDVTDSLDGVQERVGAAVEGLKQGLDAVKGQ